MSKPSNIAYSFVIADMLHYGHIRFLEKGREMADYHICGLITDEACEQWQGTTICDFDERRRTLEALKCIDEVVPQDGMDPTANIRAIHERFPDAKLIVLHGDDWKNLPGMSYIKSIGGEIYQPEHYHRLSRQSILNKFKEMAAAPQKIASKATSSFMLGDIQYFMPGSGSGMFSTKAETLIKFSTLLKACKIEPIFLFTVDDYRASAESVVAEIASRFKGESVIIRSSSYNEDSLCSSNAGCYCSILDVNPSDRAMVSDAISSVIDSYVRRDDHSGRNQVLVQRLTRGITVSGVLFTRNLQSNTPYYQINYDDVSGLTDTVTGGSAGKSVWLYRNMDMDSYPPLWRPLIKSVREIERHTPGMVLDIEFAIKTNSRVVIFQIRPLAANVKYRDFDDGGFHTLLQANRDAYIESGMPMLSDMAFWNPSEIIGDNPHPLDYGLYSRLVTRGAWNRGLLPLGYSTVRRNLMVRYGNKPYINVHDSFEALVPSSVGPKLRDKLVRHYERKLINNPSAHDKIEFEVTHSCMTFMTGKDLEELRGAGFLRAEVRRFSEALTFLTVSMINNHARIAAEGRRSLAKLDQKLAKAEKLMQGADPFELAGVFIGLLDDIERMGIEPFACMARQAFVASAISKSLMASGEFSGSEVDGFLLGIRTVASEFDRDFIEFANGKMSRAKFLLRYGHLRAGTYDITSPRYDRMDMGRLSSKRKVHDGRPKDCALNMKKLSRMLRESALSGVTPNQLVSFMKSSIELREEFKFEFTRSLSLALEVLALSGEKLGIDRGRLRYLDIWSIASYESCSSRHDLIETWQQVIDRGQRAFADNSRFVLPPMIVSSDDFTRVSSAASRPNFITSRKVSGTVVDLDRDSNQDVRGKVVFLTKADPGFDWIFTQGIKGLLTKYGGAASHMAIRCAEFNIPAAIGCGELLYNKALGWHRITLDCKKKAILQEIA